MSIGKNIKILRESKGLTQDELGKKIGVSGKTVSSWELETKTPRMGAIQRLADFFDVTKSEIIEDDDDSIDIYSSDTQLHPSIPGSKWIPVVGTIPAGTPVEAIEEILDYEEISPQMASQGEHFALKIKGQSMEPKISDSDVVIVRKQDDCDSGDVAVVLVNGDEATVKRIKKEPSGIMLIPSNPAYEPKFYSNEQVKNLPVRIIGKVVELRAKF